jgi:glutathione synthase/RimK-type ligase-like ATP-grasp enzyme
VFVLLSDGAGLTARQSATLLSQAGHRVEALTPDSLCLCRLTRHVRQVHRVPGLGSDPLGWLEAALEVAASRQADILLPVQEQVAVMSLARERIANAGVLTAVPDFTSLRQVQDKVSAFETLTRLGLPQPRASVVTSREALERIDRLPVFVKTPIGTASAGVRRVTTRAELRQHAAQLDCRDGVLVQQPAIGPLIMIQSVFANGELVAFHACERVRAGTGGGASHKRGVSVPEVRAHTAVLGAALNWHGALSADVILTAEGPRFIDINPRLVEPVNAFVSGVDLTGALVEVARSGTAARQPPGNPGARTHQALLAILGAAADSGRRRDILRELLQALTGSGPYRHGTEELTPVRWPGTGVDPVTAIPVAAATLATLIRPAAWQHFAARATSAYSLSPAAWQALLEKAQQQRTQASTVDLAADGAVDMGGDVALVPVARGQRPGRLEHQDRAARR